MVYLLTSIAAQLDNAPTRGESEVLTMTADVVNLYARDSSYLVKQTLTAVLINKELNATDEKTDLCSSAARL
jgi:hypothetical protein